MRDGGDCESATMNTDLLSKRVVQSLTPVIGETLTGVIYHCLKWEASASAVLDAGFYLGGEVELRFTNERSIFITWDENAGWADHFSVRVGSQLTFLCDLDSFDASMSPHWKPHIGTTLLACSVLGWDDTPHIIAFEFPQGKVLVGDGFGERGFGDGDDVLVQTDESAKRLPGMDDLQTLTRLIGASHEPRPAG
jgi:hypothetical protein